MPSPPSVETGTEGLGFAKFTRRKTLFNSAKGYVSLFNFTVLLFSLFHCSHGKIFKAPLKIKGTQSPSEEEPSKSTLTLSLLSLSSSLSSSLSFLFSPSFLFEYYHVLCRF